MAGRTILGLYSSPESAAEGVTQLHDAGVPDTNIDILTDAPYPEGAFGERPTQHRLFVFPLVGAACGFGVGLLLTAGTQLAYPMVTGGKPLLSIPPMLIIMYEGTMLGALLMTIIGIIFESRLPRPSLGVYDRRISEGYIGIAVYGEERQLDQAQQIFRQTGVTDIITRPIGAAGASQ